MGGMQSVLGACMIAGPALAGSLHQAFGPAAPYWAGSVLAAAAFAVITLGRRRGA